LLLLFFLFLLRRSHAVIQRVQTLSQLSFAAACAASQALLSRSNRVCRLLHLAARSMHRL
jgi:hypothetical protein